MKDKQLLQSLKIQLAQYKTFDCKLRHEEIIDVKFNTGTDCFETPLEPDFERIGFCNKTHRDNNISCAHTKAAINFKKLFIEILTTTGYKHDNLLMQAIDKLLCEIYITDIEKGSLEKQLAFSKLSSLPVIDVEKIKNSLIQVVDKHSKQVYELELLRRTIINEIDRL